MELKFIVLKNKIYQTKKDPHPVCNNSEYEAVFSFDKHWNGVSKTARFICYGKNKEAVEMFDVPLIDGKCKIPPITIAGKVTVGVYGGDIISSNVVTLTFIESPLSECAQQGAPNGSVYNKIMKLFEKYYLRSAKIKQNGDLVFERGDGTEINAGSVNGITIIGESIKSDWAESDETSPSFVKNKPTLENEVKKDSENAVSSFALYDEFEKKLNIPEQEGTEGQALFYGAKGAHWSDIPHPEAKPVDAKLDATSTNPVQNKVITEELRKKSEFSGSYNDLTDKPPHPTTYKIVKSADKIILVGSDKSSSEVVDNNTTYQTVTTTANGLMTKEDKFKLDGIEPGANFYILPAASNNALGGVIDIGITNTTISQGMISVNDYGHKHTIENVDGLSEALAESSSKGVTYSIAKSANRIILSGSDGSSTEVLDNNTVYQTATQNSSGLMSGDDKKKLDSLDKDEINSDSQAFITSELAKRTQLKPEFANNIYECNDETKLYVLPDGYIYGYVKVFPAITYETHVNKQWNNSLILADMQGYDSKNTNVIPVKAGDGFVYTGCGQYNTSIFWLNSPIASAENVVARECYFEDYAKPQTATVTAPEGATHVMFVSWGYNDACVLEVVPLTSSATWQNTNRAFVPADYEDRIIALERKAYTATSVLKGKKIVYDGDSICQGVYGGGGYAKLIADKVGGTYDNQAIGGGRLSSAVGGGSYHSVVDNLSNLPKDGDLYCFEGGINDYWTPKQLGTYSKTDYTSSIDPTTVCGALENIFRYALNTFSGKPICFVISHKIQNTAYNENENGDTFEDYRNAMVGICEKYSIPYYDAFSESGLNGWQTTQNNTFLTGNAGGSGDGCHPNEEGYKRYYVPQLIALFEKIMPVS